MKGRSVIPPADFLQSKAAIRKISDCGLNRNILVIGNIRRAIQIRRGLVGQTSGRDVPEVFQFLQHGLTRLPRALHAVGRSFSATTLMVALHYTSVTIRRKHRIKTRARNRLNRHLGHSTGANTHGPAVRTRRPDLFRRGGLLRLDLSHPPGRHAHCIAERLLLSAKWPPALSPVWNPPGKNEFGRSPRSTIPINDRVLELSICQRPTNGLTPAELETEIDSVKLRLREEIVTAAFSSDAGSRVLLESDLQTLRALEALPDAKRLAESVRRGESRS